MIADHVGCISSAFVLFILNKDILLSVCSGAVIFAVLSSDFSAIFFKANLPPLLNM